MGLGLLFYILWGLGKDLRDSLHPIISFWCFDTMPGPQSRVKRWLIEALQKRAKNHFGALEIDSWKRRLREAAMARRLPLLTYLISMACGLFLRHFAGHCFSAFKQQGPLRLLREKAGLELRTKVNNPNMTYTPETRKLLGQISAARERGDWQKVRSLYRGYRGVELPVFHAVLHAAYSCGQHCEAAATYNEPWQS